MSHSDRPNPDNIMLENGELAATADEVLRALAMLGIEHHTITHQPLYTVEDAKSIQHELPGVHTKNLFLRNKKGRMFLLVIEQDRTVDLRALRDLLQTPGGQFAFASTERMAKYLGVVPGSVTPLAVINDHGTKVRVLIDQALTHHEWIYLHPCRNTHSTRIRVNELLNALQSWNHEATLLNFD